MINNKELFFKAITSLNSSLLEVLLDETPICEKLRNDLFVERMDAVFDEFKKSGDTFLFQYKGYCFNTSCKRKCKGYIYVGNNSQKQFHAICEETEDAILNFQPFELSSEEISTKNVEIIPFPRTYSVDEVDYDGRYNFIIKQMNDAISELIHDNDGYLTQHDYVPWVEKYKWLAYESKDVEYKFDHVFFDVYRNVEELVQFLQQKDKVINAVKEYELVSKMGEKELLKWLVKYEEYIIEVLVFLVDNFDCDIVNGYVPLIRGGKMFIYQPDFIEIDNFYTLFSDLYSTKLDEYTTYDSTEIHNILPEEEYHTIYSLQFHLEKRGINIIG
jgi:hypothetical protein